MTVNRASNNLLFFYFIYAVGGLFIFNTENFDEKTFQAFAYGLSILTISILLLLVLGREIFGRDLMGFRSLSSKLVVWVVFGLSSMKFLVMGGLLWWGLGPLELNAMWLFGGALWSLFAFTLGVISHWFWVKRVVARGFAM